MPPYCNLCGKSFRLTTGGATKDCNCPENSLNMNTVCTEDDVEKAIGRRVVQICHGENSHNFTTKALCSDGSIWEFINKDHGWERLPDIPQT